MAGRKTFLPIALAAAAALWMTSGPANAAVLYAGTGTGGGTAISAWLTAASGSSSSCTAPCVETVSTTATGSTPNYTVPLAVSTGMTMTLSPPSGQIVSTGALTGALTSPISTGAQQENNAARDAGAGITLANFSPTLTSFGFWLAQNSALSYTGNLTITLTDSTGSKTINLSSSGGSCIGVSGTTCATSALTSTPTFIGITGLSGLQSVVLPQGFVGLKYVVGDYVEAPVPEPASLALLGAGLVGLGMARRRRKSA